MLDRVELLANILVEDKGVEHLQEVGLRTLEDSDKPTKQSEELADVLDAVLLLLDTGVSQQLDRVARRLAGVGGVLLDDAVPEAGVLVQVVGVIEVDGLLGLPEDRLEDPVVFHRDTVLFKRVLITHIPSNIHNLSRTCPVTGQILLIHIVSRMPVSIAFHREKLILEHDFDLKLSEVLFEVLRRRTLPLVRHEVVLGGDGGAGVEDDEDAGANVIEF